jgi:hypothetical protein
MVGIKLKVILGSTYLSWILNLVGIGSINIQAHGLKYEAKK